jgi:hypothetical protein
VVDTILKKLGVFFGLFFAIILVTSMVPNAFAGTWLIYDDGGAESITSSSIGDEWAIRFSLPPNWNKAKLLTARFYLTSLTLPVTFGVHVYDSSQTELTNPGTNGTLSTSGTWIDVDLSDQNIIVTGDFYISFEHLINNDPDVNIDSSSIYQGRSYRKRIGEDDFFETPTGNYLIRAEVEQYISSVGGISYSVNKLEIISPYIALVGLIGAISTIFAIRRWLKD